jgi:hypothetical protein
VEISSVFPVKFLSQEALTGNWQVSKVTRDFPGFGYLLIQNSFYVLKGGFMYDG